MRFVTTLEAKSSLSRLVEAIEQKREREIVITRNGQPLAKLVQMDTASAGQRLGVAKGEFEVPAPIDACDQEVVRLFRGEGQS